MLLCGSKNKTRLPRNNEDGLKASDYVHGTILTIDGGWMGR